MWGDNLIEIKDGLLNGTLSTFRIYFLFTADPIIKLLADYTRLEPARLRDLLQDPGWYNLKNLKTIQKSPFFMGMGVEISWKIRNSLFKIENIGKENAKDLGGKSCLKPCWLTNIVWLD